MTSQTKKSSQTFKKSPLGIKLITLSQLKKDNSKAYESLKVGIKSFKGQIQSEYIFINTKGDTFLFLSDTKYYTYNVTESKLTEILKSSLPDTKDNYIHILIRSDDEKILGIKKSKGCLDFCDYTIFDQLSDGSDDDLQAKDLPILNPFHPQHSNWEVND